MAGENLKPYQWKPGESGNPGGRPKKPLSDKLLELLVKEGSTELLEIVTAVVAKAKAGDVQAFNSIRDTIQGKPAQSIDVNASISTTAEGRTSRIAELVASAVSETDGSGTD